ncbi:MAG: VanZ family protein [Burkholderiaceae bacterium]|nr:VanZ family protein [Burkholderiaceae bacterium]
MPNDASPRLPSSNHAGPSSFARAGLLAYSLLIVYASWFPFTGWRDLGVSAFAYLWAPWPRYWTWFDLAINVFGYMPFGMFLVCAFYPRLRRWPAALAAIMCAILVSGTMEAVQTFMPSRVASNVDLLTNSIGAAIGAIAGVLLTPVLLEESRFLQMRERWFLPVAGRGLIVMALWPLAQIYPQEYLFGQGQMLPVLSGWLSKWFDTPMDLGELLRAGHDLSIEQYWLTETAITAASLCGALLTFLAVLRKEAPRALLTLLLLVAALLVKLLAGALSFGPENASAWLTPGAATGVAVGLLLLAGLVLTRPATQKRAAVLLLLFSMIAVNLAPTNPYFVATLQTWVQGQFLNFFGAAQFLALWWPVFALWFLLHRQMRRST